MLYLCEGNNIQSLGLQGEETLKKQMEDARKPVKPSPSLGRIFDAAEDALEGNGVQGNDAQDESEAENADEMRRHRKVFFVGTVIFVLGSVLTFVSFAFAPQSVLAPLESVQFVSNVVFTKFILKRKITKQQVIGTCLILLGCITSITFHVALGKKPDCDNDGDSSGDDHRRQLLAGDDVNQDDDDDSCEESHGPYPVPYLMHLYDNWVYQIFLGFVGGGAIILHITYYMYTVRGTLVLLKKNRSCAKLIASPVHLCGDFRNGKRKENLCQCRARSGRCLMPCSALSSARSPSCKPNASHLSSSFHLPVAVNGASGSHTS